MLEATPPNKGMKLMNQWLQLSLVCWTSFGLSGCSSPAAPTASGGESPLQLRAVTPAIGNVLLRGSSVHMSLTLVSEIASPGHVSLSIQDQSRVSLLLSEPSADIEAGGKASFEATFVVPANASSIQVLIAFQPANAGVPTVLSADYMTE